MHGEVSSPQRSGADWAFARRPFWLFSHLFAATVIISFVLLGLWQLNRHHERSDENAIIELRSEPPATPLAEALTLPVDELDYRFVTGQGTYLDGAVVEVANRTQGGVAGSHVVGLVELVSGERVLVNRGFVPLSDSVDVAAAPSGVVELDGWLRASVGKGWLGATDTGEGTTVPRFDVTAIAGRLDAPDAVAPVWLQLAPVDEGAGRVTFPAPIALPPTDSGPHLSYMGQWFIFALLGVVFYGALLRRNANRDPRVERTDIDESV